MATLWLRGWNKVDEIPAVKEIRTRMSSEEASIAKHLYLRVSNLNYVNTTLEQELHRLVTSVKEDNSSYLKIGDHYDRSTVDVTFTLKNGETYRAVSAKEHAAMLWVNKL